LSNKPNILIIMADQLAASALSLYGNKVCKTPNLDKLAHDGIVFENAYSNNPVCVPSRASMLSGHLTPEIAVYDNANELACSVPTMAHYMRSLGYWTFLSGKMHFIGPDQLHGFNERLTTDVYPANFDWIGNWSGGSSYVPSGTALNGVVEAGPCIRTMQEDYDDEVEYQSLKKIYDLARYKEHNPFFGIISFTSPHTPFNVAQKYWNLYDEDKINVPDVGPIPFDELDYFSKSLFFAHGRHRHTITEEHIRKTRQAYYGMISYVDEKIGKIIKLLEDTNQRDNTAIFFVSDHGEMLGERGMWFKQCFFEWSSHVPMIASIPGASKGIRSSVVTSLVDLLPTIIEIGNNSKKEPSIEKLAGKSLIPFISGFSKDINSTAISDYYHIGPCVPTRMIRKNEFKLIYTHGHPNLLFDLKNDPNELKNLSDDKNYKYQLSDLLEICKKGWNPDEITKDIIKSQRRRLMLKGLPGDPPEWDFIAQIGDENRYVRKGGVDATKSKLRIPPIETIPPDLPELDKKTIEQIMAGKINHNF
jgi:choline-sulfatase